MNDCISMLELAMKVGWVVLLEWQVTAKNFDEVAPSQHCRGKKGINEKGEAIAVQKSRFATNR